MSAAAAPHSAPLLGLRVVELAAIGPAPMAAMLLSDLGAEVLRIERAGPPEPFALGDRPENLLLRGRCAVMQADLKTEQGSGLVRQLATHADVLIEGFRPGTLERLGLGPTDLNALNPGLIFARMTGWGQGGPLAQAAGHDINYIALTGALDLIGRRGEPPTVPLNLLGDFAGGSLYLVVGILAALHERARSGLGQVVDAAIVDGTSSLLAMVHALNAVGRMDGQRGERLLDGGAWFYGVYECADGCYLAVGAMEPRFCAELLRVLEIDGAELGDQYDRRAWPAARLRLEARFRERSRDEWMTRFDGVDACVSPVLSPAEAVHHPHMAERGTLLDVGGVVQPAPAPRFSRSVVRALSASQERESGEALLKRWQDTRSSAY